jgi:FMN-dependent NADH-azoreductase
MSTLLYIEASPTGKRSRSIAVAKAFLDAYMKAHPGYKVVTINVFDADLPVLDGDTLAAKYAYLHGQQPTKAELARWEPVVDLMHAFKAADKYVIATPMWNFSIPYRLKQYIDLLVNSGETFSYSPDEGYKGLVVGKPAVIICARGGQYPVGSAAAAMDLQTKYLELILGFIGFTDLRWLLVEPTLAGEDVADERVAAASENAKQLAAAF